MIERLMLVCVALLSAGRTYVDCADIMESQECKRVKNTAFECTPKYRSPDYTTKGPKLPEEFFKRVESNYLVAPVVKCMESSIPINETVHGCTSEIAMTLGAHCIRAEMFNMVPLRYKYSVLEFLDFLVVCMADLLQQPLAILRSGVESSS
ncbi:uncharacterized protein [Dermacentor albipictus]|uniref:uncharacterized protein n=1 Tax=Dermacentor albipictus TaxID=60249 RepID=UPI0038FC5A62